MFRDNSEMAVAINVASPDENPTRDANARPSWRAVTMSLSTLIGTTVSSAKARAPSPIAVNGSPRSGSFFGFSVQVRETLLQVERGRHPFERQTQLDQIGRASCRERVSTSAEQESLKERTIL